MSCTDQFSMEKFSVFTRRRDSGHFTLFIPKCRRKSSTDRRQSNLITSPLHTLYQTLAMGIIFILVLVFDGKVDALSHESMRLSINQSMVFRLRVILTPLTTRTFLVANLYIIICIIHPFIVIFTSIHYQRWKRGAACCAAVSQRQECCI